MPSNISLIYYNAINLSPPSPEPTKQNKTTIQQTLHSKSPEKQCIPDTSQKDQPPLLQLNNPTPPPCPVTPPSPTSVTQLIPIRLPRVQPQSTYNHALPRVDPPTLPHIIPHSLFPKIWSPVGPTQH